MRRKPAPPKPISEIAHLELTRLPRLTIARRLFRQFINGVCRLVVLICTRARACGLENFPTRGPALVIANHLGDADIVVGMAFLPAPITALAKIELYDLPVLGWIMDAYGVIWVRRGQPDRRALKAALDGLEVGRLIGIAPEGRESMTGELEEGTGGAAFLALKSGVALVPVTFTGTENATIFANLKRLRRSAITLTIGPAFFLNEPAGNQETVEQGTQQIMEALARQLPPEYRGPYQ